MTTDEETAQSVCTSHVDSDEEPTDLSCEEHVDTDNGTITHSSSNEDLATTIREEQKQSYSFKDESCDEDFPDEFFLFPSDCGNIGLILGDEDWEKIETNSSSQESLTSDDGGTSSTCIESGDSYGVNCDGDSKASSHSSCYSPVPKEQVSYLSCGSEEDSVTVTSGCVDQIEESHQDDGEMNYSCHGSLQWSLERHDSYNQTSSIGCASSVCYDNKSTHNRLYECNLISDEHSFDLYQGLYKHDLTMLSYCHTTR